jgi:uncharacterized protein (DUF2235 family)
MTRIAIFCDGTWNSSKIPETTSIHKLQSAVQSDPSQGQVAAYFAGVGTDARFKGRVGQFFNKWGGGAFGWGCIFSGFRAGRTRRGRLRA